MNPGQLDRRVKVLGQTSVSNSYGERENIWNEIVTTWANIKPLQGRELFQADQVHAEVTSKVTIRFRSNILPNMRLQYGERIYQILYIINVDERNSFLELWCKEVV